MTEDAQRRDNSSGYMKEDTLMASRRCPYCKAVTSYEVGGWLGNVSRQDTTWFRTEQCRDEGCAGFVVAFYSSDKSTLIDLYPKIDIDVDAELPPDVKRPFTEALGSLNSGIWNGCVIMCRRALDEAMQGLGAKGSSLYDRIKDAVSNHLLTPSLGNWADEARLAGNLGAHGDPNQKWAEEMDAVETFEFCTWVFRYLYILPTQLEARKARVVVEHSEN